MGNYFKEWYEENGDSHNEKRKRRYETDPEYRNAIIERQRAYRQRTSVRRVRPPLTKVDDKGVEHLVYRVGLASQMVGRSPQTLKKWERKGYIPKPSIKTIHRYYTAKQVELMIKNADFISSGDEPLIRAVRMKINQQWRDK